MKILIVNKFLYPNGGSETYIFKLGDVLKKHGHEVQYFGMEHLGRCVGNRVNAYTEEMDFHGGSKVAKLTYPIKTIYNTDARKKIRLVLDDFQPDVVHLNNFTYQITPSIIVEIIKWRNEKHLQCRIIFTAHDTNLICPNHMMKNPNTHENCEKCLGGHYMECTKGKCIHGSTAKSLIGTIEAEYWNRRNIYSFIDAVICPSKFIKTKYDTNTVFSKKTVVIHNFLDRPDDKIAEKRNYILYFGRFSEEKGIGTLLKVAYMLPDVKFIFAGKGPLEGKVNSVPNVVNVGFQSGKPLVKLIREALVSVCPSEIYENCPFSVMESQMYGTPVIGADIGGIPELIQEGKTGEVFQSGNAEELKEKIEQFWNDRVMCRRYSENCKQVQFETPESYYEKIMRIYEG